MQPETKLLHSVSGFQPLHSCICKCDALQLPSHHTGHLITSFYHPQLLFDTADQKPSHGSSFLGFLALNPILCLMFVNVLASPCMSHPATSFMHLLLPPFDMAKPKLSHTNLVPTFWPQTLSPTSVSKCNVASTTCIHITPPPHPFILHCFFCKHTQNQAVAAQFQVFGPKPPLLLLPCTHHTTSTSYPPLCFCGYSPSPFA